uniref:Uncharacterized protein n=1 Tax=Piliocolobus tephrosceles TaxID=591936 RepID=A0A8C9HXQ1_9PRIM
PQRCSVFQLSGFISFLTSPFMWRWTRMAGALSVLATPLKMMLTIGYPFLGSQEICRDSKDLFVPTSSRLSGCFFVDLVSGMAISVLLLASNFRKLDLSRPEPCLRKNYSSLWYNFSSI